MDKIENSLRPFFKYSEENLKQAIDAVADGMTYGKAAKTFGVPKTTLLSKFKGKSPMERKMGPATVLSKVEEKLLSDWIQHMQNCGFPITKFHLIESVQRLLNDMKRDTVFKGNRPGRAWYDRFMNRNPEISERVYQNLTRARSSVTEQQIRNWFTEVNTYMEGQKLSSVLKDPTRVFNMDETAFFLNPDNGRVLAKKGSKTVYSFVQNDEKECLTALIGSNADGKFVPPMVVFPYVRVPERIATTVPSGWGIGRSENGWMTGELFFEYIANIFHPWLLENKIKLPVILFVDGHTSHLTLALSDFCSSHGIILMALFPNATHIIQPMDVGLFHALKVYWRRRVLKFRLEKGAKIKRENFCELLQDTLTSIKPKILQSAFKACGLYPFDPNAINYAKTIKKTISKDADKEEEIAPELLEGESEDQKLKSYLFFVEYIHDEKLNQFIASGDVWNGALEDKSLFEVWKKMCGDLDIVHELLLNENEISVDLNELAGEDMQIDYSNYDIQTQELSDDEQICDSSIDSENDNHRPESSNNSIHRIAATTPHIINDRIADEASTSNQNIVEVDIPINIPTTVEKDIPVDIPTTVEKDIPNNMPTAFRKNLLWPNKTNVVKSKGARKPKEIIPAVTVSDQWKEIYKKKEEEKILKEQKKQQRKVSLEAKKIEKEKKAEEIQKRKLERSLKLVESNKEKAEKKAEKIIIAEAKKIEAAKKAADKKTRNVKKRKLEESDEDSKRSKIDFDDELQYEM